MVITQHRYWRSIALAALAALGACSSESTHSPDAGGATPPPGSDAGTSSGGGVAPPPPAPQRLTFESGPVRPLALSADHARLFIANTPNASLDVLRITAHGLVAEASVKVGIDPVAVAVRSDHEVWVVNHVSDSVSIVDPSQTPPRVVRTLLVGDEPSDVVFAGNRAFITTAHRGQQRMSPDLAGVPGAGDPQLTTGGVGRADVWVFDADQLGTVLGGLPRAIVTLFGDTPRGLAVTPDGKTVYAAIFKSGNQTTATGSQLACPFGTGPCTVAGQQVPAGPPGPPTNAAGITAPQVSVILKQDAQGAWRDSRGIDWTGNVRFQLPDQDVFAIDAQTLAPTMSFAHVGTTLFNLAVNPVSGAVYVSNTESRNDLAFEGPGTFAGTTLQGHLAETRISVLSGAGQVAARHLNKHIPYGTLPAPAGVKDHSLSTPLDLVVSADGKLLYVAAFGSAKVGVFATEELEHDTFDPTTASAGYIDIAAGGPSGLALDGQGHLFVSTRFDDGVSMIDLATRTETSHVQLTNPEVATLTKGRPLLYDARATSSNGEAACASCHMFGDTDHLVWNLGNPDADLVVNPIPIRQGMFASPTINGTGDPTKLHPMKGPMATQTLLGLVNHGPMHWRGDRVSGFFGIDMHTEPPFDSALAFKNFIVAFPSLLGRDTQIAADDMQAFSDFALSMIMQPNPNRAIDNSLTATQARGRAFFVGCAGLDSLTGAPVDCSSGRPAPGTGHFSDGAAIAGLGFTCEGCHVLDPAQGMFGTNGQSSFEALPQIIKIPQLRNLYTKIGMFGHPPIPDRNDGDNGDTGAQMRGNGFEHDGSIDTLFRFLQGTVFNTSVMFGDRVGFDGGDPERLDVEQFLLAFDSDLAPVVGQQVTLDATNAAVAGPRIDLLLKRARTAFVSKTLGGNVTECDLVARGVIGGAQVTFSLAPALTPGGAITFNRDDGGPPLSDAALRALAQAPGQQLTYTALPPGWTH
jgi:DNA-binding beta-propeller fold protein YncE